MAGEGAAPLGVPPGTESSSTDAMPPQSGEPVTEKPKADLWKLEPQPIREDQVANAVNFLSHPKVKSSPIVHRRTFLERKGLTPEEIDEAFRRVPDPPTSEAAATTVPTSNVQARAPLSQPMAQASAPAQALVVQKPGLSWGQKLLGIGAIVTAGAGAGVITKAYLLPMFKSWVRSIMVEESETDKKITPGLPAEPPVNEAALAANAAAAAAAEVAAAMREFSHAKSKESLQLGSIIKALETQTHELKTALSGMRDVVNGSNNSNGINNNNNNSEFTPPIAARGYRQDPWRTPEMPRPSGMLTDRTYAGAVLSPTPPAEKPDSSENGAEPVITGS